MNDGRNLDEIRDLLYHVVAHMATKDELAAVKEELKGDITALRGEMVATMVTKEEFADFRENVGRRFDKVEEKIIVISNKLGISWGFV